jgi:regulation of enolase protein 1 (concanavalin A-like superfamily)
MRKALCVAILAALSLSAIAQSPSSDSALPGFPKTFKWRNSPVDWGAKDGVLTIRSAGKTDWYVAAIDANPSATSPLLLFPAPRDFWFSAKVTADFKSQFDAGALVVYADEKNWVKFAFESQNGKTGSIVSVVTRGLSDDNTGTAIEGSSVYLKVSKTGPAFFLYFSMDGKRWNLTRAFNLGPEQQLQFGFSAQSPMGAGSTATFSEIHYKSEALKPWTGE